MRLMIVLENMASTSIIIKYQLLRLKLIQELKNEMLPTWRLPTIALSTSQLIFINGVNNNLNQIIRTQGGFAFRVDLCVNRGLGGSILVLKKAIE